MIYDDKSFIGSVIRNARKKAKLSQAELSEQLGMSEKNLSNIENGRQFPQVNNFLRIIQFLNIPLEDFGVTLSETESDNVVKTQIISKILSCPNSQLNLYDKAISLIDETIRFN